MLNNAVASCLHKSYGSYNIFEQTTAGSGSVYCVIRLRPANMAAILEISTLLCTIVLFSFLLCFFRSVYITTIVHSSFSRL